MGKSAIGEPAIDPEIRRGQEPLDMSGCGGLCAGPDDDHPPGFESGTATVTLPNGQVLRAANQSVDPK